MARLVDVDAVVWEAEVLRAEKPVLVEFWHEACIWCKRLEPELEKAADRFAGKFTFARLNVRASLDNMGLSQKYGIMGTPTMILFCQGRPVSQLVGYRPHDRLVQELADLIETYEACFKQSTPLAD